MTTAAGRRSGGTLTADALVDRRAIADQLAEFILRATTRVVVLHGRRASGKTSLVRHGIMRSLTDSGRAVAYGACAPALPPVFDGPAGDAPLGDLLDSGHVVFVDNVEHLFDLPRDESTAVLDGLFARLGAGRSGGMLVLIVDSRHLTAIYALADYDPAIAGMVREIEPLSIVEGLEKLRRLDRSELSFDPDLVTALHGDARRLAATKWEPSAEMLWLVYERLRNATLAVGLPTIQLKTYERLSGIEGMLREHLDERLRRLDAGVPNGAGIGAAMLEFVVASRADGVHPVFEQLAIRLPADLAVMGELLQRMVHDPAVALLRRTDDGAYELNPGQLEAVVIERIGERGPEMDRARRLVEEGLRSWQQLGVLVPRERFAEVHQRRADLSPDDEALRFLLLCALSYGTDDLADAPSYWLNRSPNLETGRGLLLFVLRDADPAIRRRAVALLTRAPDPEVVDRLFLMAVNEPDPDPAVRAEVIATLNEVKYESLCDRALAAVRDRENRNRIAAIDVLQIFPEEGVVRLLTSVVDDRTEQEPERAMAIRVLSRIQRSDAIEELLKIALTDADAADRRAAAEAVGMLGPHAFTDHLLARLDMPSARAKVWLTHALAGLGAIALAATSTWSMAANYERVLDTLPLWLLIYFGVSVTLLGGLVLRRIGDGRLRLWSLTGLTGLAAFLLSAVTIGVVVRGLAHASIGRGLRAASLFATGGLGVFVLFVGGSVLPGDSSLSLFYLAVGMVLVVGSYGYDVAAVLGRTVLLRATREAERRRADLCRRVMANPAGTRLVLANLTAAGRAERVKARSLLWRFGADAHADTLVETVARDGAATHWQVFWALTRHRDERTVARLADLARGSAEALRRRVLAVLGVRPTDRTLQLMEALSPSASLRSQSPLLLAQLWYRLRVWSWQAWVAVALLIPIGGVFVQEGWQSLNNPGWAELRTLRSRVQSDEARLNAIESLVRNHASDAERDLLSLLQDSGYVGNDVLYGALATGLMDAIERQHHPADRKTRPALLAAAGHFQRRLNTGEQNFPAALSALSRMTVFRDSAVSRSARTVLVGFMRRPPLTTPISQKRMVIAALGRLPARQALPLLDSLLGAEREPAVQAVLQQQIERSGLHGTEELNHDSLLVEGDALVGAMAALHRGSMTRMLRSVMISLRATVTDARSAADTTCPDRADRGCRDRASAIASALAGIRGNSQLEAGYQDLVVAFDTLYAAAADRLRRFRDQYPQSIWPGKVLSELYLDKLAPRDSTYFDSAYAEVRRLRSRTGYRDGLDLSTWQRFEGDFAEIALTTGRFDSLRQAADELLATPSEPRYRLNMALFRYVAAVVARDGAAARQHLDSLGAMMAGLPPGFYNGWSYHGTIAWVRSRRQLTNAMKSAIIALCREGFWFKGGEVTAVLELNRGALTALRTASTGR